MADVEEGKKDLIRTIEILMRKPAFDAVGQIKGFPWYEDEGSFALWQKILMADLNAKTGVDGKIQGRSFAQKDFAEAGYLRDHFDLPEYAPALKDIIQDPDPTPDMLKAVQGKMLSTLLTEENARVLAERMREESKTPEDDLYLKALVKAAGVDLVKDGKDQPWKDLEERFVARLPDIASEPFQEKLRQTARDYKQDQGSWALDNPDRKAIDAYIQLLSQADPDVTSQMLEDYTPCLEKLGASILDDIGIHKSSGAVHQDIIKALENDPKHPVRVRIENGSKVLADLGLDTEGLEIILKNAQNTVELIAGMGSAKPDFLKKFEEDYKTATGRLDAQRQAKAEAEAAAAAEAEARAKEDAARVAEEEALRQKRELEAAPAPVNGGGSEVPPGDVLIVPPADAARIETEGAERARAQAEKDAAAAAEAERIKIRDAALEQEMKEQSRQRAEHLKGERQRILDATPDPRLRPADVFNATVSRVTSFELQDAARGIMAKYQENPKGLSDYARSALKRHFAKNQSEAVFWQSEKDFAMHGLITPGLKTILKETRNGRSDSEAAENAREKVMEALTLYADAAKRGSSQALRDMVDMVKQGGINGHSWKKLGFDAAEAPSPQQIYEMITDTRDALRARQLKANESTTDSFIFAANDKASLRTVRTMEQEMLRTFKDIVPKPEGDVEPSNILNRQGMDFAPAGA